VLPVRNFILESAECWVIVNFQKSRRADHGETTFYVNVAACSTRWLGLNTPASARAYPARNARCSERLVR
jgi:hypothetical protein